jgi:hypothetical protein
MNIKISIEVIDNEIFSYVDIPKELSQEQQHAFALKFASTVFMMQTGEILPSIFQSVVSSGILTNQKLFSELIIRKILDGFNIDADNMPMINPSDAFLFREKQ